MSEKYRNLGERQLCSQALGVTIHVAGVRLNTGIPDSIGKTDTQSQHNIYIKKAWKHMFITSAMVKVEATTGGHPNSLDN